MIILQAITIEDLLSKIQSIVEKSIEEKLPKPKAAVQLMTRNEVAKYLKISLPTLHERTKEGLLPSYKIGNRVLYKSNEFDETIRQRKYSRTYK